MPDIKVIPNTVSKEDIQTLISYIEDNCENPDIFRKQPGVAHEEGLAYRSIFPMEKNPDIYDKKVLDILAKYAKVFIDEAKRYYEYDKPLYLEGISLTKLTPGIQLRIHKDIHGLTPTVFSGMLYLNDDFEDGEIVFLDEHIKETDFDLYKEDGSGLIHPPASGELVIFKASQFHGSRKVQGKARYAIALWSTSSKKLSFKGFDSF
jgi:hypothetical protein